MRLSYSLKNPVTVFARGEDTMLAVRDDKELELPSEVMLVGTKVKFEPQGEQLTLDFCCRSPENDLIALRFLQFLVQAPLLRRNDLWRPRAGGPFFLKTPVLMQEGIGLY